jgi:hypothetical protein
VSELETTPKILHDLLAAGETANVLSLLHDLPPAKARAWWRDWTETISDVCYRF